MSPSPLSEYRRWFTGTSGEPPAASTLRRYRALTVLATALVVAAVVVHQWQFGGHRNQFDLQIYYRAVNHWINGDASIYDYAQYDRLAGSLGYTYPPISALIMSPMGVLPLWAVVAITCTANIAAAVVWCLLILRDRVALPTFSLVCASVAVAAVGHWLMPVGQNFEFGQINLLLALLATVDLLILGRRNSRWFGVGIGIAMAIKLTPGVFLLPLLLLRRWRALATACVTCLVLIGIGAVFLPSDTHRYYGTLLWQSNRVGNPDNTTNWSLGGMVARFSSPEPPPTLWWLLLCLLALALTVRKILQAARVGDLLVIATVTGMLGVLVSPISWLHHAVWVLPAMILLVLSLWSRPRDAGWWWRLGFVVLGVFCLVINLQTIFFLPPQNYWEAPDIKAYLAVFPTLWMLAFLAICPLRATVTSAQPVRAGSSS